MEPEVSTTTNEETVPAWRISFAQGIEVLVGSFFLDVMGSRLQQKLGGPDWLWEWLGVIPDLMELVGFWMVTLPAVDAVLSGTGRTARRATRCLAVGLAVFAVVDTACVQAGAWEQFAALIYVLPALGLQMVVFAVYLVGLARNEGRIWLARQSYVAMWGLAAGLIGLAICFKMPAGKQPPGITRMFTDTVLPVGSILAILVFGIWTVVLMWRYKKLFAAPLIRDTAATEK